MSPIAHFPKTMTSKPVWGNNEDITSAKATVTGSWDQLKIELGLSATYSGTYTFEEVENGVSHTFTATGKWIKWRLTGISGIITKIEIQINA